MMKLVSSHLKKAVKLKRVKVYYILLHLDNLLDYLYSGVSVRPENTVTYSADNGGRKICGDFSETALLQRYTASCVVGYCSDIPRTFLMAEPCKGSKRANNMLNSTWNTTRCKVVRFFLFSLRLLPKVFRILSINVILEW